MNKVKYKYYYEISKEGSFNSYFLSKKYGCYGCEDFFGKKEKPELFEKLKLEEIKKIYGLSRFGEVTDIQEIDNKTGEIKKIYKRQSIMPIVATVDGLINKNCYK